MVGSATRRACTHTHDRVKFLVVLFLEKVLASFGTRKVVRKENRGYLSIIGEPNPKHRSYRWENLSSLSTTPQSHVEPM